MAPIVDNVAQLVGRTPLVRLDRFAPGTAAPLLAKLEYINPSGSSSDRVVQAILERAEADGALVRGGAIVEATAGNIAYSLAMLVVPRGYRLLSRVPRIPPSILDRVVEHFGSLQKLLAASVEDLQVVDGVGDARARSVREGISRLAEVSIIDRFN